jgi:hypothetical protein
MHMFSAVVGGKLINKICKINLVAKKDIFLIKFYGIYVSITNLPDCIQMKMIKVVIKREKRIRL